MKKYIYDLNLNEIKKRTFEEIKKTELRKYRIFKPLKNLDCEIRMIIEEINEDRKEVYFIIEIGYYESLGERGLINSFFYDDIPTEEEILKDIKKDLSNDLEKYNNKLLSGYEEIYLNILSLMRSEEKK